MPDPTVPEVVTPPRKIETDLSKAMASEAPPPEALKRTPPKSAPSDGAESFRTVGQAAKDEREFLQTIWDTLDGMRVADPDTRRLKLIVQALVKHALDAMTPPADPPVAPPAP